MLIFISNLHGRSSFPIEITARSKTEQNMSSTNLTEPSPFGKLLANEAAMFIKNVQWKTEYFTPAVYITVLVSGVLNAVTFPFTALLNGIFILSVLLKKYFRKHKSCVLLAFLAMTDLLVGAVVQPMLLVSAGFCFVLFFVFSHLLSCM